MSEKVKDSWGTGLPVSFAEMATAGIRKAMISTMYWATWVQVMPFMPPTTAKKATMAMPMRTPQVIETPRKRENTTPTPRIWPVT